MQLSIQRVFGMILIVSSINFFVSACSPEQAGQTTMLNDELNKLKAANGLYMSPVTASVEPVNLEDSAFDLSVLALTGHKRTVSWSDDGAKFAVQQQLQAESVWGTWMIHTIEKATGIPKQDVPYDLLLSSYDTHGFFAYNPNPPPDLASKLASTAAALQVISEKHLSLSEKQRSQIIKWIDKNIQNVSNPYQMYNVISSLEILNGLAPANTKAFLQTWWEEKGVYINNINDDPELLDIYGYVLSEKARGAIPNAQKEVIESIIEQRLNHPADAFTRYYLALTWEALGGNKNTLQILIPEIRSNQNDSGWSHGNTAQLGSIDQSFLESEIRVLSHIKVSDKSLANTLHRLLQEPDLAISPFTQLEIAATLHNIGQSDPRLEQSAVVQIIKNAPSTITLENVNTWGKAQMLLQYVKNNSLPKAKVEQWPLTSEQNRYAAWLVLAHLQSINDPIPESFKQEISKIPSWITAHITDPNLKELEVAVEALSATGNLDLLPVDAVNTSLQKLKGCGHFTQLYRLSMDSDTCDLEATSDAWRILRILGTFNNK